MSQEGDAIQLVLNLFQRKGDDIDTKDSDALVVVAMGILAIIADRLLSVRMTAGMCLLRCL